MSLKSTDFGRHIVHAMPNHTTRALCGKKLTTAEIYLAEHEAVVGCGRCKKLREECEHQKRNDKDWYTPCVKCGEILA